MEGTRVALEDQLDGLVALVLVLQRVRTVYTVAVMAKRADGKAVAIQLQTLGLCTIAWFAVVAVAAACVVRGRDRGGGGRVVDRRSVKNKVLQ